MFSTANNRGAAHVGFNNVTHIDMYSTTRINGAHAPCDVTPVSVSVADGATLAPNELLDEASADENESECSAMWAHDWLADAPSEDTSSSKPVTESAPSSEELRLVLTVTESNV